MRTANGWATVAVIGWAAMALGQSNKPVAVVNGEPIPLSELDAILASRPQPVTPLTTAQRRQIHEEIVSGLVDERLLKRFLEKQGAKLDAAEVDKQWTALLDGLKGQGQSIEEYCQTTKQTPEGVRKNLVAMLQWNAYAAGKVTDAEVQKFYAENKPFFDKATVRCSHIVLRAPVRSVAEREDARKKLEALRAELVANKLTFAEAAIKYSQCPSAPKGGDLGEISRKYMVEEPFAKAAFALDAGQISPVVATEFGLHLILVAERKAGEPSDFAKIKDEVRECCLEETRQALLADLRRAAKVELKLP